MLFFGGIWGLEQLERLRELGIPVSGAARTKSVADRRVVCKAASERSKPACISGVQRVAR
jgi:hypothetical protein